MHRFCMVAFFALTSSLRGHAQAQPQSPTAAEQLISVGINLRQHGDDAGALRVFQQAYQIAQSPRALGQIALAEQALGRWLDAELHMRETLSNANDAWVTRSRTVLSDAYREVRTHVAELLVEGATSGDVVVNGDIVAVLPMTESFRMNAGECTLEVRAPGFSSETRSMFLPGGEITRIVVELRPMIAGSEGATHVADVTAANAAPTSSVRDHTMSHWLGYGGIILGGASLVLGAIMTANVFGSASAVNGPGCDAEASWARSEMSCASAVGMFDTAVTAQWVGYSVGAVLLGVGIGILVIDGGGQERESSSPSLACTPTGPGASCALRF